jgi:hypothetical protein
MLVSRPLRRTSKLLKILIDLGLEGFHLGVRHVDGDSVLCMSRRVCSSFGSEVQC